MSKLKVGDLVKYIRKGNTRFPIPREESTGVVVEIDTPDRGGSVARVYWAGTVSNHAAPPPWISESLLEILSQG